jgi:hypothetical protein
MSCGQSSRAFRIVAGKAVDDKAVRRSRIEPDRERSVLTRMSGAGADYAIPARNIASERARSRTHIGCVHGKILQGSWLKN